jgi:hypothetical protein
MRAGSRPCREVAVEEVAVEEVAVEEVAVEEVAVEEVASGSQKRQSTMCPSGSGLCQSCQRPSRQKCLQQTTTRRGGWSA